MVAFPASCNVIMSWMIEELVGGVSFSGLNMTNDNRPKDALPRTRYNSSKQSISGRRRATEWRTFSVDPQQGCGRLGLPFHGYIPLEEPRRRPLMLSLGRGILISGGIWRRQPRLVRPHPAPALLNDLAHCSHSTSVPKRNEIKELLTLLFLLPSFPFLFI